MQKSMFLHVHVVVSERETDWCHVHVDVRLDFESMTGMQGGREGGRRSKNT